MCTILYNLMQACYDAHGINACFLLDLYMLHVIMITSIRGSGYVSCGDIVEYCCVVGSACGGLVCRACHHCVMVIGIGDWCMGAGRWKMEKCDASGFGVWVCRGIRGWGWSWWFFPLFLAFLSVMKSFSTERLNLNPNVTKPKLT
jgi:hypothetical protein